MGTWLQFIASVLCLAVGIGLLPLGICHVVAGQYVPGALELAAGGALVYWGAPSAVLTGMQLRGSGGE